MEEAPVPDGQASTLRFLKLLVTVLTGTMIVGLITIIALFVIRFPATQGADFTLPKSLALPPGTHPEAVTFGAGWIAVVAGDSVLVFDRASGALRKTLSLKP